MANSEHGERLGLTGWARPTVICCIAILLALIWSTQFENAGGPEGLAIAAPERTNVRGGIELDDGTNRLTFDRVKENGAAGIGMLDTESALVNPLSSGLPWSALGAVDGLLTFRGNPTRTFHGRGPVPEQPVIQWSVDIGCSDSSVGGDLKQWCGTGWTGQPAVFPAPWSQSESEPEPEPEPGDWWVGVGGYNKRVNFFDPDTGVEVYPGFATDDIIKGSITVDPDGYPLVYTGSRDNFFHIVAIDGDEPEELWRLSADDDEPTLWNNDWDSSALVIDDHLFVGGENSRFYVVELNRSFDRDGTVAVDPEVVFSAAGWDEELLAAIGDRQVSIENSVAISGDTVYFANSGGLVQGWDVSGLASGRDPKRTFRYWVGDDADATIVIDDDGMLYVVSEYERGTARSRALGQVFKLDPSEPDDPLVWSQFAEDGINTGAWATPALHGGLVIVPTADGRVLGLERDSGVVRWTLGLPGPLWSSPVVVDDTLIQGDCQGVLNAFDLSDPEKRPKMRWSLELDGCIESTPAVWGGQIFVGTRSGLFYGIGEAGSPTGQAG